MQNPPFDALTTAGIDTHFRNRQRTLMSVDDYVRDIFRTLEAAGVSSNTYVLASSDHGYHLGEWGLPFEKSTPYETDVRTPLYAVGPGVVPGSTLEGMASLMDIGATFLVRSGGGGRREEKLVVAGACDCVSIRLPHLPPHSPPPSRTSRAPPPPGAPAPATASPWCRSSLPVVVVAPGPLPAPARAARFSWSTWVRRRSS